MPLITRQQKGSKLTIAEMDGNLEYLQANGFVNGQYSQTLEGTGAIIEIGDLESDPSQFTDAVAGTYVVTPIGGSGTGAILELVIVPDGNKFIIDFPASTITSGGSGYEVGRFLQISTNSLGGTLNRTINIELTEGSVDVTQTSEILVSENAIVLSTQRTNVYGDLGVTGDITANSISAQGIEGGLSVTGSPTSIIMFNNLPTSDPRVLGQLWADPAKGYVLIVSQG
jgi:hypothetical protein